MLDYYYKNEMQRQNTIAFHAWARKHQLQLFQPSPTSAPWHVQAWIAKGALYPQIVNFWPHLLKGYWNGHGVALGLDQMTHMLKLAYDEAMQDEIELIEND